MDGFVASPPCSLDTPSRKERKSQVSILAVVVLYNRPPSESVALTSLQISAGRSSEGLRLRILVYDNTPGASCVAPLPANTQYLHGTTNGGLAVAYNAALEIAKAEGFDWLLTLDHDTTLPETFLADLCETVNRIKEDRRISAIVPRVFDSGVFISPHTLRRGKSKAFGHDFAGVPDLEVAAINSGSLWRVEALLELGGFNPLFWLDYLDHWVFHVIQRAGKSVYVAGSIKIEQQLSLLSPNRSLTSARFENILQAGSAFYDIYKNPIDRLRFTKWMFLTLCGQSVRRDRPDLRQVVWKHLKQRVFTSRSSRIRAWKEKMTRKVMST